MIHVASFRGWAARSRKAHPRDRALYTKHTSSEKQAALRRETTEGTKIKT